MPVPLEDSIRFLTCGSSGCQAAWVYSFDQAVENRFSADLLCVDAGHGGAGSATFAVGDALRDALVRPGRVVARLVLGQDRQQVCLVGREDPAGRPGLRLLLVLSFLAVSSRCQARSVAGVTGKMPVQRLRGMSRASAANQARSAGS